MIDTNKYEGHLMDGDFKVWGWSSKMLKVANYEEQMATSALLSDAPLLLAAYDKQVRWINDILFRLEKMQEASEEYRSRYLQKVYEELEMMIE